MKKACKDISFILRLGAGLLFISGGLNKLLQLLNPEKVDKILASYNGTSGYINEFFHNFLYGNAVFEISQFGFLTTLSGFEFISGVLLILGIWVRPLSLIYSLLLWTFVVALPVMTIPGIELEGVKSYYSPAILVQIRDITLSFMFVALLMLGTGKYSIYYLFDKKHKKYYKTDLESSGGDIIKFLLRFGLALTFLVGGLFAGMDHIKIFGSPTVFFMVISFIIALLLIGGHLVRYAAIGAGLLIIYYILTKLSLEKSLIGNLNGVKREFALLSMAYILALFGGGKLMLASQLIQKKFWTR